LDELYFWQTIKFINLPIQSGKTPILWD